MVPSQNTGRRKSEGNHSHTKNKVAQDLERNQENGYPDTDFNKTKINYTKDPNELHKNNMKEEMLQVINENFIRCYQTWSNKTNRRHSGNSKTTKTKNMRKPRNK
jgi:hypothetical protein